MDQMQIYDDYIASNSERFLSELDSMCRQPSISSTGQGIQEMVPRVVERLEKVGAQVQVFNPDESYPIVLGTLGDGPRTLLLYDHYDTQPIGPLDLWYSPPFEPEFRDGILFGRGVGDDKGELVARIKALEAYQHAFGELPIRIKFLVEGAHEIGSPGLSTVVKANRERLRADACVSEGLGRDESDKLVIHLGCRGFAYLELVSEMRDHVLASMYGSILPDPAWRLTQALATMITERGDLSIDDLATQIVPPSESDLMLLKRIQLDERQLSAQLGVVSLAGDRSGLELLKRYLFEPFATICSFVAGDPAAGLMLPGRAVVRLDIRMAPNLDPETVEELVCQHLQRRGFDDIQVVRLGGVPPDRCPADARIVEAAIAAARHLTGCEPVVWPLMPACSPSHAFHETLGTPVLFAGGVTHSQSNLHAANENIRVADYLDYIKYFGRLIQCFAVQ